MKHLKIYENFSSEEQLNEKITWKEVLLFLSMIYFGHNSYYKIKNTFK